MDVESEAFPCHFDEAARAASDVIELLEVLWERGRGTVPPAPVSAAQVRVLYVLDREEGINLRTLGEALGSTPSSVSRLCDRLQAVGLVERAPSPVSRREVELRLTGRGRAYLRELRDLREKSLRTIVAAMPPASREALAEGLRKFRSVADEAVPWCGRRAEGGVRSA
ncbi:MarR family winged helix-turn-helix transcriptional regulator [Streptomyces macrosporus]|uniref:MarR family transcriptional regulator n=1 Tax=Streptomyces macrosporus TaxID=44032 RepID=A0ABN3JNX8_9ACTN